MLTVADLNWLSLVREVYLRKGFFSLIIMRLNTLIDSS